MSLLEELLNKYCPDGVEYKNLGEVCSVQSGGTPLKTKSEYWKNGNIKWLGSGVWKNKKTVDETTDYISELGLTKSSAKLMKKNTTLIALVGATIGKVAFLPFEAAINQNIAGIYPIDTKILNPSFVYYICTTYYKDFVSLGNGKLTMANLSFVRNLKIPLPPIEVQKEIVRILDTFTEYQDCINEELTLRKKQYEYYRDKLFQTAKNITNYYLTDISKNCDNERKPITSSYRTSGKYPYYGASGIIDYVNDYIYDGDYLLISEDGANLLFRKTPIAFSISGKNWVNNHAHVLHFDNYETRRYVEIYLNSIDLSKYITGGAQPKLNQKNLNQIVIPLPPLEEQERIVKILDRFEALCNDISSGLPAEIEMRKKQYEYYRDKLLTFKEKKIKE